MLNAKTTAHSKPNRRLPAVEREFRQWFSLFGGEVLMNLAIYADESGTHDKAGSLPQSEVVVMAGYAGKKESWIKFIRNWNAVLNKYGVTRLHFTQLQFASNIVKGGGSVRQKGNPYRGWSKHQCEDFLLDCAKVAAAGSRLPVGADFDTRRYSRSQFPEQLR